MNRRQHWIAGLVGMGVVLVSVGLAAAQSNINRQNNGGQTSVQNNGGQTSVQNNGGQSFQNNGGQSFQNNGGQTNPWRLTPHQNTQGVPPNQFPPPFPPGPYWGYFGLGPGLWGIMWGEAGRP